MDLNNIELNINTLINSTYDSYINKLNCVYVGHNVWYHFKNHKWNKIISDQRNPYDRLFNDPDFELKLDNNPDIIGFTNGVFDLKEIKLRSGLPSDYISLNVGYDYKVFNETDPIVQNVESYFKSLQPDENIRNYVLKIRASFLDGHNKGKQFYLWLCGEYLDTPMELLKISLGDYYYSVQSRSKYDRWPITPRGIRLFAITKSAEISNLGSLVKEIAGQDYLVLQTSSNRKYGYKPQYKPILFIDVVPDIPFNDNIAWRLLNILPWTSEVTDQDFLSMRQAFIWLLLNKYYPLLKKDGLQEPENITKIKNTYRSNNDIYGKFINENYNFDTNSKIYLTDIYSKFKEWLKLNNPTKYIDSKITFVKYLCEGNRLTNTLPAFTCSRSVPLSLKKVIS